MNSTWDMFYYKVSMDPFSRDVPLKRPVPPSPFDCKGEEKVIKTDVYVVFLEAPRYGAWFIPYSGLTAQMNNLLRNTRLAVMDNIETTAVEFPARWGNGCGSPGAMNATQSVNEKYLHHPLWSNVKFRRDAKWTCMFQPVTRNCRVADNPTIHSVDMTATGHKEARKILRMKRYYNDSNPLAFMRNKALADYTHFPRYDADLPMMKYLFQWMFQLNSYARGKVDELKRRTQDKYFFLKNKDLADGSIPYIGFHIRHGDKVATREMHLLGGYVYIKAVLVYYKRINKMPPRLIYIVTDDYAAVTEVQNLVGPSFTVITSATEMATGYDQKEVLKERPNQRYRSALNLWSDIEILAGAEIFVGALSSNVGRVVHLMRYDYLANQTLDISVSCCRNQHQLDYLYHMYCDLLCA